MFKDGERGNYLSGKVELSLICIKEKFYIVHKLVCLVNADDKRSYNRLNRFHQVCRKNCDKYHDHDQYYHHNHVLNQMFLFIYYELLQWFPNMWNADCHGKIHGVDLKDPCSVLLYLSEVGYHLIINENIETR